MKLHFPAEINTNEIPLDGLSASLDSVTTGISTKGFALNVSMQVSC